MSRILRPSWAGRESSLPSQVGRARLFRRFSGSNCVSDEPSTPLASGVTEIREAKPDPYAQAAEAALRGARAAVLGICASVALAIIKILAGVIGNAYALVADGVESVLDVFSSLVVWNR
jgi:hypothetical protein